MAICHWPVIFGVGCSTVSKSMLNWQSDLKAIVVFPICFELKPSHFQSFCVIKIWFTIMFCEKTIIYMYHLLWWKYHLPSFWWGWNIIYQLSLFTRGKPRAVLSRTQDLLPGKMPCGAHPAHRMSLWRLGFLDACCADFFGSQKYLVMTDSYTQYIPYI